MTQSYDVAIAGAGILGLAHAYALARRGLRVAVFERGRRAQGASIRNFGMIWPIGQPSGSMYALALRSRDIWLEVLRSSGLWHTESGSLHLAYHEDEAAVLREFVQRHGQEYGVECLSPSEVLRRFPAVQPQGLQAGLWSPREVGVDPRQVIAELPDWLQRRYGVQFFFDTTVIGYHLPQIHTTRGSHAARRLILATGADFRDLAPESFARSELVPVKLQMMRTAPYRDFRLGTMMAGGLTLRHYKAFADCPSLPALAVRLDEELPAYGEHGIHVMAAQNGQGELVLGDTHHYGDAIDPFDRPELDELVLAYLRRLVHIPDLRIAARWHGIYVKHPTRSYVVVEPSRDVFAVTGVGGAGMTLSFGLADQLVEELL
ncbi:MAG: TIGR03364 family FAD-dependent oxidoreductase [Gemmataceae bacterium]